MLYLVLLLTFLPQKSDFTVIRIIWTSDLHGQLLPTPDFAAAGMPRRRLGGIGNLINLIQRERTKNSILLDNGDFAFGSPEGDSSQGRLIVQIFNRLGYDATVLGARDFTDGLVNIELLARAAGFPILADPMLNIRLNRQSPLFRPYILKNIAGVKVGIIGLSDPEISLLNRQSMVSGLPVEQPLQQVSRFLPALKAESAEVIIVLGHIPVAQGRLLTESIPDIDLIICRGEQVIENQLPKSGKAGVVVSGVYGQRLGIADILFHKLERRVYAVEAQIMNVSGEYELDSSLNNYRLNWYDTTVAYVEEEFFPDIPGKMQLARFLAEGLRRENGADIVILPTHLIENGLTAGPLTRRDLFNAVPYRNRLRIISLPESLLYQVLKPVDVDDSCFCPAVVGLDLFVIGDTTGTPRLSQIPGLRLQQRKGGYYYKVITTEEWFERSDIQDKGKPLSLNLTDFWLRFAERQKIISPVEPPKLHPATSGLAQKTKSKLININIASVQDLCQLPGIGPKTAERIIEYRTTYGKFNSIEEIMNVRGIGPKKYEKIKDLITVR